MIGAQVASNPLTIWLLILVSTALVAGITYVYTNRNHVLTTIFTLLAIFIITLIKVVSAVNQKLHEQFLSSVNNDNIPYIVSHPGWHQLLDAWHIWILPVLLTVVITSLIFYAIIYYQKNHVLHTTSALPMQAPPVKTRAEKLSRFMAMDAARKEAQHMNEKLAEALLMNAAYEIKVSDLTMRIRQLEKELINVKHTLTEETETLQLELSAKSRENDYIVEQLAERSRDLARANEMFEKLLALQQDKIGNLNEPG